MPMNYNSFRLFINFSFVDECLTLVNLTTALFLRLFHRRFSVRKPALWSETNAMACKAYLDFFFGIAGLFTFVPD